ITAPKKATNTVGKSPPPAGTPRAQKIQPAATLPKRPSSRSPISPYPPSFITIPDTQPPSTPPTTHETLIANSMIRPPSPGAGSVGHRLPFAIPLDWLRISLYKLYINYKFYGVVRPGGRPHCS